MNVEELGAIGLGHGGGVETGEGAAVDDGIGYEIGRYGCAPGDVAPCIYSTRVMR